MSTGEYDFSQVYHASCVAYSPGSTFLATSHLDRVIVRSTSTLNIVRTWQCVSPAPTSGAGPSKQPELIIDRLEWAADGLYILAFASKAPAAWVFGLASEGSGASGELAMLGGMGLEGLIQVGWSKSGKDVLAWSDHGLRLTAYSLSTGSASLIQNPKGPNYSRYFAVVERHAGKEHLGIYDALDHFKLVRHFLLKTADAQGVTWSPCGKWIAVWDSPLSYSLHVYSPIGAHLSHFSADLRTFSASSKSAEDPGLGIRSVDWAPGGRYLAIGGWDGRIRIFEIDGLRCLANLNWAGRTSDRNVAVWREPHEWLKDTRGRGIVQFDRASHPSPLPTLRTDLTKFPPLAGVSHISFNPSGTHLFVRLETQPCVLHVHTFFPTSSSSSPLIAHFAALVFNQPVKDASWGPTGTRIAVVTRSGAIFFWDNEGWVNEDEEAIVQGSDVGARGGMTEGVGIPSRIEFAAQTLHWSPDGSSISMQDRNQFCLLYDESASAKDLSGDAVSAGAADQSVLERSIFMEGLSHVSEGEEEESMVWQRHAGRGITAGA